MLTTASAIRTGRHCAPARTAPRLAVADDVPPAVQSAIDEYVRFAHESARPSSDDAVESFLQWCGERHSASPAGEFLTRAAEAAGIEHFTLGRRLTETRFQQLAERGGDALEQAPPRSRIAVYFNPQHAWTERQAAVGGAEEVLLCATAAGARVIAVPPPLSPMLRRLSAAGSRPLKSLTADVPGWSREEVLRVLRELARQGVIAAA